MGSKDNAAVQLLKGLGVYAFIEQRVSLKAPNQVKVVKKVLKTAQKNEIARLRIEQKYYEFKLDRLTKLSKPQKINGVYLVHTIEGVSRKEYLGNIAKDILSIKKQIQLVRGI